jgi:hypothetical protein
MTNDFNKTRIRDNITGRQSVPFSLTVQELKNTKEKIDT